MGSERNHALLTSILAEKLESRGFDDEMLEVLMEKECVTYGKLNEFQEPGMSKDVRSSALLFLKWCASEISQDPLHVTSYIKAVQLFDLAALSSIGSEKVDSPVWALAAAAWSLTLKMDSCHKGTANQLPRLIALAGMMRVCPKIAAASIEDQEQALFLKCNVSAPAPSTWCNLFCARLDAILCGVLGRKGHLQHVNLILERVLTMAVESVRVSREIPPYIFAVGSFCLALVAAELVPLSDVIEFQQLDTANVESKLAWMKLNLGSSHPACKVPREAITAATVVALRSNAQAMKLAATSLVNQIQAPHSETC